jgi:hypothetical protein
MVVEKDRLRLASDLEIEIDSFGNAHEARYICIQLPYGSKLLLSVSQLSLVLAALPLALLG